MNEVDFYADQLNIETPEQVDLHFPIAGVGSRFIAMLLDLLVQILVYVLFIILIHVTAADRSFSGFMDRHSEKVQNWMLAAIVLLNFLMVWGYFALFEAFWNGQTPGKHWMKLRVMKDSGRSITLFESMARNLLRVIDALPGFYLVGIVSMLCNKRRKRLGDFVAGTMVVHERLDEQPLMSHVSRTFTASMYPEHGGSQAATARLMPKAQEAWAATETGLAADAVAKLDGGDLHVIETFFSRALDLSIAKREELGLRLAERMSAKMGVEAPAGAGAERMLELIAFKMRAQGRG